MLLVRYRTAFGVGADPGCGVEPGQVGVEAEPGLGVERLDLGEVDRVLELLLVVHAGVPRGVAAGAQLELGAQGEDERAVDLRLPVELVGLLCGVVGRRGLRAGRVEPSGHVAERGRECDPRLTLRGRLRHEQERLGEGEVRAGVGDVHDLQARSRAEQLLDRER